MHVRAALYGILHKIYGLIDADAIRWIDRQAIFIGELTIHLHQFMQTILSPANMVLKLISIWNFPQGKPDAINLHILEFTRIAVVVQQTIRICTLYHLY